MPEPHRPSERTAAQRQADHAGLARLSETLLPALVAKLNGSDLGELEVHEGDWKIRLRRPATAAPGHRRPDRVRPSSLAPERRDGAVHVPPATAPAGAKGAADGERAVVTSPAVGIFRAVAKVGSAVRLGDRIAVVDLLGIPQEVVAPIDGVLSDVLVEAGEAVEYGEEVAVVEAPAVAVVPAAPGNGEG
jgi:acetyl-CoA carboxylase biotin carboxyl carrier protein